MITERDYVVFRPVKITLTGQGDLENFKLLLARVDASGLDQETTALLYDLKDDMNNYE